MREGDGYKVCSYEIAIKKKINKIVECRRLKKQHVFAYLFKEHLFKGTLLGDCC